MEPWTIQPTKIERQFGRLLRGPDGEHETATETETKTEEKSLVTGDETKAEETKTEEAKVEETKAEEKVEEKAEEVVVEPLTAESLTIPEGLELQPELTNKFLEILNGDMAPQDRANALIALQADAMTQASEASSKAWDDMQTEWKDAVKADPDIGGAKLQPTLTNISKLINEFGSDELKGAFDLTGAGNNPHVIKFLGKIAEKLTEGNFFTAGTPSGTDAPDAAAKRMFPSMKG